MKYLTKKTPYILLLILICSQLAIGAANGDSKRLSAEINQANKLIKANKTGDAISLLKPDAADLPRHGLLALAKAYHLQKNYLEEGRILENLNAQNEKDYYILNLLAECYFENHDFEKAADNFSAAKEIRNDFLPAYQGLVKTYETKGQFEDARQVVSDMMRIFGTKKFYLDEICRLYSREGSVQEGINACQKATSFDPALPANHINLGRMLIENDQPERGEMIIVRAAKQFQKSEAAQIAGGNIKLKHRQWHDATSMFLQATIVNSRSDEGFLGLGKSLFEMKKYSDAKTALIKACTINKKYLSDLRNAIAELRQKDQNQWATQFESGLSRCGG